MKINNLSILIIFLSFSVVIFSQNKKIDSLKIELQKNIKKDTTRVNILNALAFSYFSKDMPKTLEYLEEADALAEVMHFKKGKARSIYIRGITESIQANYDQAFRYYNEALKLYENINFKRGIANCYNAMAIAYKNKGELRKSISYLKKAIRIEEETGGKNLSAALINLGSVYQDLGEFNEALLSLKKALSIAKIDENEQRVAYSINNLGTVYMEQGNYPLALEHFKKSLYINEKLGDSLSIAQGLYNMGSIYKAQEYYDKAMRSYEKSLEINERINSKKGVSLLLNNIGSIHEQKGDYKSALDHYVNALSTSKQIGTKSDIPNILNNIGGVYLALKDYRTANQYFKEAKKNSIEIENKQALCGSYIGLAKTYADQKEYDNALSNGLKAKEISEKSGFLDYQKKVSEILSKIYKAIGKHKDALESHEQFKKLNDSLFNKKNIEKITQLEYEYKYKRVLDSASIRELKLTKTVKTTSQDLEKSQRNLLLGVIAFLTMTLILGGVIFYLKLRNVKSKTQNIIVEQKLLRSQMTPHFIFNSLSVLQGMILNKEEKKSVSYLSKFSKLLRITLDNSRDKTVSLCHELTAVENYLELQNLEDNTAFEYAVLIDDNIDRSLFKIPPMLIQPFVENAIEHAFINQKGTRTIDVRLSYTNRDLICTITDNGIGIATLMVNKNQHKKSLSTSITTERLKILSKDFNMKGSVTIEDRQKYNEKGTVVTLVIPYVMNIAKLDK